MSMSMSMNFNASIDMSMDISNKMVLIAQDLAERAVKACGDHYGFDSEEAIRLLNLRNVENKKTNKKVVREKVSVAKSSFALPYNGEYMEGCCDGLRYNNGLYTQCQVVRKGGERYCKGCQMQADKNTNGKPDYGTIQDRNAVGIFEYIDPSGKKPVSYLKVMNKLKLSKDDVLAEAKKMNKTIDEMHFEVAEKDTKRGRPKVEKVVKEKQTKGRPKKEKKVVEISGDLEDLFASLVLNDKESQANEDDNEDNMSVDSNKEKEEKLAAEKAEKEAKRQQEKAEKEAKRQQEKAEKEVKLAAEKAEKESKLAAEKAEKEAKRQQEKAEKEAKEAKREQEKAEKEAKRNKKEKEGSSKASDLKKESNSSEEDKTDKVKKITYEGTTYYRSTNTGVIYNTDQDVVGVWNKTTEKIDFTNEDSEEDEEEYEEEE